MSAKAKSAGQRRSYFWNLYLPCPVCKTARFALEDALRQHLAEHELTREETDGAILRSHAESGVMVCPLCRSLLARNLPDFSRHLHSRHGRMTSHKFRYHYPEEKFLRQPTHLLSKRLQAGVPCPVDGCPERRLRGLVAVANHLAEEHGCERRRANDDALRRLSQAMKLGLKPCSKCSGCCLGADHAWHVSNFHAEQMRKRRERRRQKLAKQKPAPAVIKKKTGGTKWPPGLHREWQEEESNWAKVMVALAERARGRVFLLCPVVNCHFTSREGDAMAAHLKGQHSCSDRKTCEILERLRTEAGVLSCGVCKILLVRTRPSLQQHLNSAHGGLAASNYFRNCGVEDEPWKLPFTEGERRLTEIIKGGIRCPMLLCRNAEFVGLAAYRSHLRSEHPAIATESDERLLGLLASGKLLGQDLTTHCPMCLCAVFCQDLPAHLSYCHGGDKARWRPVGFDEVLPPPPEPEPPAIRPADSSDEETDTSSESETRVSSPSSAVCPANGSDDETDSASESETLAPPPSAAVCPADSSDEETKTASELETGASPSSFREPAENSDDETDTASEPETRASWPSSAIGSADRRHQTSSDGDMDLDWNDDFDWNENNKPVSDDSDSDDESDDYGSFAAAVSQYSGVSGKQKRSRLVTAQSCDGSDSDDSDEHERFAAAVLRYSGVSAKRKRSTVATPRNGHEAMSVVDASLSSNIARPFGKSTSGPYQPQSSGKSQSLIKVTKNSSGGLNLEEVDPQNSVFKTEVTDEDFVLAESSTDLKSSVTANLSKSSSNLIKSSVSASLTTSDARLPKRYSTADHSKSSVNLPQSSVAASLPRSPVMLSQRSATANLPKSSPSLHQSCPSLPESSSSLSNKSQTEVPRKRISNPFQPKAVPIKLARGSLDSDANATQSQSSVSQTSSWRQGPTASEISDLAVKTEEPDEPKLDLPTICAKITSPVAMNSLRPIRPATQPIRPATQPIRPATKPVVIVQAPDGGNIVFLQ